MDPTSFAVLQGTAGAGGESTYVDDVFSTYLYEGQSTSTNTINNGLDLAGEGGLVWIKRRDGGSVHHYWFDTERTDKYLNSNTNTAQFNASSSGYINRYTSTGFVTGDSSNIGWTDNFASWSFRKAPGFFDVVTYTGNGTAGREISHSLGSTPGMVIVKRLNGADNWTVQHRSLGGTKSLYLNLTDDEDTSSSEWNNTAATASVFTVGTSGKTNANGDTYIAYLFAHDDQSFGTAGNESIIKCGSYTGSTSAVTVDLGFEPQWVMIKRATGGGSSYTNWGVYDNMRGINASDNDPVLCANLNSSEGSDPPGNADYLKLNPTGFTVDPLGNQYTMVNTVNQTFIYVAIRRPNKPVTAGTEVFHALSRTGTGSAASVTGFGFPPDMVISRRTDTGDTGEIYDRVRGRKRKLETAGINAEDGNASATQDLVSFDQDGLSFGTGAFSQINYSGRTTINWNFRRAPGFFDIVCYTGTSSARNINHNLGVIPEMMIIKSRSFSNNWAVYHSAVGATKYLRLNRTAAEATSSSWWNDTAPTSSVFTVGTDPEVNDNNGTLVAYLFATRDGVSKVGSYSGTGNNIDIDCGFTSGARFIMIKRTDTEITSGNTSGWYVWDSVRGIVSGDDPYVRLNDTSDQVTNRDWIDPLNAGFTVTSDAPLALNTSGGNYIFLAIA